MQYLLPSEPLAGRILYIRKHVRAVSTTERPVHPAKPCFAEFSPLGLAKIKLITPCRGSLGGRVLVPPLTQTCSRHLGRPSIPLAIIYWYSERATRHFITFKLDDLPSSLSPTFDSSFSIGQYDFID